MVTKSDNFGLTQKNGPAQTIKDKAFVTKSKYVCTLSLFLSLMTKLYDPHYPTEQLCLWRKSLDKEIVAVPQHTKWPVKCSERWGKLAFFFLNCPKTAS